MARANKKKRSKVYIISVAAHLAVGIALASIPKDKLREVIAIALNEAKEEKKPEPPKPQAHAAAPASRSAGHRDRPVTSAAPAAEAVGGPAGFADIGLALDSSSSDGIAVNMAPPPTVAPPPEPVRPKVLVARKVEVECMEDIVKARPLSVIRPVYTESARQARIEGRVVIEISIDDHGEVTNVRVVKGLGFGLDEAALEAAKRLHFAPATRCKRAVAGPFLLGMRFALPQ